MLRMGAAAALAAGVWPGWLRAGDGPETEDFTFVAVNDLHYMDERCGKWLEGAFKQMTGHEGVEFCLLVGDLVEDGRVDQLHAVKDVIKGSGLETHIVIGNHDYAAGMDRGAYEKAFPDTLNYRFEHKGWQFVGLDTTQGRRAKDTIIVKETMDWVAAELPKLDRKRPTIMFTHFPLGFLLPYTPKNRADLLEAFGDYNLQAVFNGHFHSTTLRHSGHATLTTNRCCSFRKANHDGSKEKGYFLCKAKAGEVTREFVEVKVG
jgi:predicted MPP superfamily phosphohydrolase